MATLFKSRAGHEPHVEPANADSDNLERFLRELGELSYKYGLALTNGASLYAMEREDYARTYRADAESQLTFA